MRVTSVEAIPVSYPEPNDFNALRHLCLVKLVTDDGQVGWGDPETGISFAYCTNGIEPDAVKEAMRGIRLSNIAATITA